VSDARLGIVVVGAAGRMGQALVRAAVDTPGVRLAAAVEAPGHAAVGVDAGEVAGIPRVGVLVGADLGAALAGARVVVDFATAEATTTDIGVAAAHGVAAVVGTTALGAAGRAALTAAAARVPIVVAPNMSVGINLLFALLPQAARVLGGAFDVGVTEIHHGAKRDAPSGTALRLCEVLREAVGHEVPAVSLRGGSVAGDHTAYFLGPGERLEITHRAENREPFARGAMRAALWVAGQAPGLYDMQDVLGLR
jgi:4-hydroxy-tetrahydrodipicolinate reductase